MGKYVDLVKQRAIQKRQELEQNPASIQEQFEDMAIAEKFLRHPKGFAVSQPIMSLVVLKFLGFSDEEMKDLYYQLVYEQSTQDQDHDIAPDPPLDSPPDKTQPEPSAAEDPPEEEPDEEPGEEIPDVLKPAQEIPPIPQIGRLLYWQNGKRCQTDPLPLLPGLETYYYTKYCFGKKDANGRLHTLVGNEWQYGGPFRSYYFDAQYDCLEVDYVLDPNTPAP